MKLGEAVQFVDGDRGENYPQNHELLKREYCLFLNTKNVPSTSFYFSNSDNQFITREKDERLRKGKLLRGDFVLTTRGTVGNFGHYNDEIPYENVRVNSGMVIIRNKDTVVDPEYFKHYLASKDFNYQVSALVSGSAQPQLPIRDLSQFIINLPPLDIQKQIASTLSAFNDKIEVNNQIAKTLEEMTQAIFKEWFVKIKFPGHEKVRMVNSELGKIPEGWVVKPVDELVKRVAIGKKYDSKSVLTRGNVPVLDQGKSGIIGYHNNSPDVEASENNPAIVFANHTCYQNLVMYPFSAIQNVIPYYPSKEYYRNIFWLYFATFGLVKFNDYKGHWPEFASKRIMLPVSDLCEQFGNLAKPILIKKYRLINQENQKLAEMRDLLLPKLMRGEVRV